MAQEHFMTLIPSIMLDTFIIIVEPVYHLVLMLRCIILELVDASAPYHSC
jgi:hypothetical protein